MSRRCCGPAAWLLAAAAVFAVTAAADEPFAFQTLSLGGRVVAAEIADLDGDGRGDLLAIVFLGLPPREQREILVFFQREDGSLSAEPDRRLPLPPGAAAYDLAKLDGQPGLELLFLHRDGLRLLSLHEREPAFRDLAASAAPTFAAAADERGLDRLRLAHEGLGEALRLVVPGLGRTAILSSDGKLVRELEVGARANYLVPPRPGPVYAESEIELYLDHPRLSVGDVDGDGRADLVAASRHELRVFLQDEEGGFPARADRHIPLDRVALGDHVRGAGSVRVETADFDGDGRLDLLIATSRGSLLDASSSVGIHLNRGGRWDVERADQIFRSDAGHLTSQVVDLDGDGRVELVTALVPTRVLEIVEALVTRAIDVELSIYRQDPEANEPFHAKPWHRLRLDLAWSFETLRTRGFVPTLTADLNGDGFVDFLDSGDGTTLEVRLGREGSGYAQRDARQSLDTGGRLRFGDFDSDGLTDLLLYDPRRPTAPLRLGVNRGTLPGTPPRPSSLAPAAGGPSTPSARAPARAGDRRSAP